MERAKQRVQNYLNAMAEKDSAFAEKMKNENKDIDKCMQFIISEVHKIVGKQNACIDDDTVYGFAVHYYDEENIEEGNMQAKVVYAGAITDEEREQIQEQARQMALQDAIAEQKEKIKASAKARAEKAKKKEEEEKKEQVQEQQIEAEQLSLF